jgi:hypothetical protein
VVHTKKRKRKQAYKEIEKLFFLCLHKLKKLFVGIKEMFSSSTKTKKKNIENNHITKKLMKLENKFNKEYDFSQKFPCFFFLMFFFFF